MRARTFALLMPLALLPAIGVPSGMPFGAGAALAIEPDAPEQLISATEAIGIATREVLQQQTFRDAAETADKAALLAFYAARESRPLWVDENGLTARAEAVIAEISRADSWGLRAGDFALPAAPQADARSAEAMARAEAQLSMVVLKYARHARGGRIPNPSSDLSSFLDRKPQLKAPSEILDGLAASAEPDAYLRDLHPQHEQFQLLRKALLKMRGEGEEEKPALVMLPAAGPALVPGKSHPDVALLRQRLDVPVTLAALDGVPSAAEFYDESLAEAVRRFQKDNGLAVDGIVGRGTRASLNGDRPVPVSEAAVIANMEQWRWMPEDLGDFYVQIDIPEYMMRVKRRGGEIVHAERIIVGKIEKQTPVFSDVMKTIVFHPFWGVPNSIKVNELLPSLARNGDALRRQNLRVQYNGRDVDASQIDWTRADIRNFHVYQPPGGSNVLGQVKFMFPNHHQTYMHDTPTKNLFNTAQRTYSHGCMRVRDPLKLAEVVLAHEKGWDRAKIDELIDRGPQNNEVVLETGIPVHMTYFTVVAKEDGSLETFRDVYQHQRRIELALAGRYNEIPRHRDHLLPVQIDRSRLVAQQQNAPVTNIFQAIFGF